MVSSPTTVRVDQQPKRTRIGVRQSRNGCFTCKYDFGKARSTLWLPADRVYPELAVSSVMRADRHVNAAVVQRRFVRATRARDQPTALALP
jgi:hypothetical protein